jgi:hypothetical protein
MRNHLLNPVVRAVARTPARRLLARHVVVLGYVGHRTGRRYELPVMATPGAAGLVVMAGRHRAKTWWRNFVTGPREVTVRSGGCVEQRIARLVVPDDAEYGAAMTAYRRAFPRAVPDADTPLLLLAASGAATDPGPGPDRRGSGGARA